MAEHRRRGCPEWGLPMYQFSPIEVVRFRIVDGWAIRTVVFSRLRAIV
jgi:hypothetical protein